MNCRCMCINLYIRFLALSMEGLEAANTPQEQWAHLAPSSWFLNTFVHLQNQVPGEGVNFRLGRENTKPAWSTYGARKCQRKGNQQRVRGWEVVKGEANLKEGLVPSVETSWAGKITIGLGHGTCVCICVTHVWQLFLPGDSWAQHQYCNPFYQVAMMPWPRALNQVTQSHLKRIGWDQGGVGLWEIGAHRTQPKGHWLCTPRKQVQGRKCQERQESVSSSGGESPWPLVFSEVPQLVMTYVEVWLLLWDLHSPRTVAILKGNFKEAGWTV